MDNEPVIPQGNLTPDLARQNPEIYKSLLIEKLADHAPQAALALHKLTTEGLIPSLQLPEANKLLIPSGLEIDSSTWVSHTLIGDHLKIGTQSQSPELKHKLVFEDNIFDYEHEITYRFTHEIAHILSTWIIDRQHGKHTEFEELFELFKHIRGKNPAKGFSTLGNLPFYKDMGAGIQANEDFTELVAKYLYDPEYLRRYLSFLSNPSNRQIRESLSLEDLTPDSASEIFQTIQTTVDAEVEV